MTKQNNVNKFSKYFNLPNPGLVAYFSLVRDGQSTEYRTTFYKHKTVQEVLSGWDRILKPISKEWPSLYEFETDMRGKVGPMSIMKPLSERHTDIDSYYESILLDSKPLSEKSINAVIKEWASPHLAMHSVRTTVDLMKKSTNSGSPYFCKRRNVLSKSLPCDIVVYSGKVDMNLPSGSYEACAILGWRGQEGGPKADDVKQRVVWMFPMNVNIEELRVYQALIEYAQHKNLVPAWVSMESVDEKITKLFDTKDSSDVVICTDFSKFDQHFNEDMHDASLNILKGIFRNDQDFNIWSETIFPIKYSIPLAYDWDKIRTGNHGMASGSGGTNADETLAHRALQYEAAIAAGAKLNPNSQCLGDDGILSYPGIKVEDVIRSYTEHGQEMNTSKQYVSKLDCVYLRRWHHAKYRLDGVCVGVYSTHRALGRLCEQERFYDADKWSNKMVALRQLSIIENCKYHPLRNKFADYCMKGDKYRLGLDIPGFLDNIDSEAKEAIDLMPDFLGYTKSMCKDTNTTLSDWWIVKYLKSKLK